MTSLLDLTDQAYAQIGRTIRWGEDLAGQVQRLEDNSVPLDLVGDLEDFFETAAYYINFYLDADAFDQVESLGFDPRSQERFENIQEWDVIQVRLELSLRLTLLVKWYDELLPKLREMETLHQKLLSLLAENSTTLAVNRSSLQMRLKLENRPMREALDYLSRQGMLGVSDDRVWITDRGKREVEKLKSKDPNMANKHGPHDLVFFSYAREDHDNVSEIYRTLEDWGFNVWWDERSLVGGQDWEYEIAKAIEEAAVCLVFLSNNSVAKTGYVNKEIKRILDKMDMMPEGKVFMIPIRLDDCAIPMRLRQWQVLDYNQPKAGEAIINAVRHAL